MCTPCCDHVASLCVTPHIIMMKFFFIFLDVLVRPYVPSTGQCKSKRVTFRAKTKIVLSSRANFFEFFFHLYGIHFLQTRLQYLCFWRHQHTNTFRLYFNAFQQINKQNRLFIHLYWLPSANKIIFRFFADINGRSGAMRDYEYDFWFFCIMCRGPGHACSPNRVYYP